MQQNNQNNQIKISDKQILKRLESLEKLKRELTQYIQLYISNVKDFIQYKATLKETEIQFEDNQSEKDKIKIIETKYDKVFETNSRTKTIVEIGEKIEINLNEFNNLKMEYSSICSDLNDRTASELNEMLNMMKNLEYKQKPKERDMTIHERDNYDQYIAVMYDNYFLKTKAMIEKEENERRNAQKEIENKKQKLKEEKRKEMEQQAENERYQEIENLQLKETLSKDTMKLLETSSNKWFNKIIFNSQRDKWKRNQSDFANKVMNKSNILILIKTSNETIGCYIGKKIDNYPIETTKLF